MRAILDKYRRLDSFIINLLIAEFFLQLVNAAFQVLSNFFLLHEGYHDQDIGHFAFCRFLAVMLFALPFAFFIKVVQ